MLIGAVHVDGRDRVIGTHSAIAVNLSVRAVGLVAVVIELNQLTQQPLKPPGVRKKSLDVIPSLLEV